MLERISQHAEAPNIRPAGCLLVAFTLRMSFSERKPKHSDVNVHTTESQRQKISPGRHHLLHPPIATFAQLPADCNCKDFETLCGSILDQ